MNKMTTIDILVENIDVELLEKHLKVLDDLVGLYSDKLDAKEVEALTKISDMLHSSIFLTGYRNTRFLI